VSVRTEVDTALPNTEQDTVLPEPQEKNTTFPTPQQESVHPLEEGDNGTRHTTIGTGSGRFQSEKEGSLEAHVATR
jgi:hypothetical protein